MTYYPTTQPPQKDLDVMTKEGVICFLSSYRNIYIDANTFKPLDPQPLFWTHVFRRDKLESDNILNESI